MLLSTHLSLTPLGQSLSVFRRLWNIYDWLIFVNFGNKKPSIRIFSDDAVDGRTTRPLPAVSNLLRTGWILRNSLRICAQRQDLGTWWQQALVEPPRWVWS